MGIALPMIHLSKLKISCSHLRLLSVIFRFFCNVQTKKMELGDEGGYKLQTGDEAIA